MASQQMTDGTVRGYQQSLSYDSDNAQQQLLVQRLTPAASLPSRRTSEAAGLDIAAAEDFVVPARGMVVVSTGLAIKTPPGTYGRLAPRSSLACYGLGVNAGVVDRDYTGEVKVVLQSFLDVDYHGKAGDRVAQLVVEKIAMLEAAEVSSLPTTERLGGFGSTGHA